MSTNSTIFKKIKNNKYKGIYCHSDGYIGWNGILLYTFYDTEEKVKELIDLGDLSILGARIGKEIDYERRCTDEDYYNSTRGQCVAYYRDRKDAVKSNFIEAQKEAINKQSFNYLYEDGVWWVSEGKKFILLKDALIHIFNAYDIKLILKRLGNSLTEEEMQKVVKKIKPLVAVKEPVDYVIVKQRGLMYDVMEVATKKVTTINEEELFRLIEIQHKIIRKKWGNTTRKFVL